MLIFRRENLSWEVSEFEGEEYDYLSGLLKVGFMDQSPSETR